MSDYSVGAKVFIPDEIVHEDTFGMYPLPMFADINNTGNRLQETVNQVGFPILASDLFLQKKKTIFDMKARQANSPQGHVYEDMSYRRSEYFNDVADTYNATRRIGIGDSLGVPAIQGMQLYGETKSTFDAILLRDGWNLDRPASTVSGIGRYALYQIKDALYSRKHPNRFVVPDHGYDGYRTDDINETNILSKLLNVADMMRGEDNEKNAYNLAEHVAIRGLALHIVCLRNGLSGSEQLQRVFLNSIQAQVGIATVKAMDYPSQVRTGSYMGSLVDGWHSDLLNPTRAANDIRDTLRLLGE